MEDFWDPVQRENSAERGSERGESQERGGGNDAKVQREAGADWRKGSRLDDSEGPNVPPQVRMQLSRNALT